jgi:hypothetical protein
LGGGITLSRIELQRLEADGFESWADIGATSARRRKFPHADLFANIAVAAIERRFTGDYLVQGGAQTVDVARRSHRRVG